MNPGDEGAEEDLLLSFKLALLWKEEAVPGLFELPDIFKERFLVFLAFLIGDNDR